DRLGQPGIDEGRIPGGRPRHRTSPLRGLGAHGDPVGIRRRGLGDGVTTPSAGNEYGGGEASPSYALQKASAVDPRAVITPVMTGKRPRRSPSGRTPTRS